MLKILLKKQLYELNSSFFYDRKKGKARAKSTSILFIVLYALLMIVVIGMGKIFIAKEKKVAAHSDAAKAAIAAVPEAPAADAPAAPGTAGKLKLYDVEPKTAAMLMAIVADKMGKPLNELRFKSIKEVK
mgnify:CR=1 FL=1